jgi:hypothetical protein
MYGGMSALGLKRTFAPQNVMSALPAKADICSASAHVRYGPIADIQDARFEALKMYLLLLKKYLPASFKLSNSLCHSIRSLAETSRLPSTKFRTNCACPLCKQNRRTCVKDAPVCCLLKPLAHCHLTGRRNPHRPINNGIKSAI